MSGSQWWISTDAAWRAVGVALRTAQEAEWAAARAAEAAAHQERLAAADSVDARLASLYRRIAATHRRSAACQLAAARMHKRHAWRKALWAAGQHQVGAVRPVLLGAAAVVSGWDGAVLTLSARPGVESLVAASDERACRIHEVETVVGQGPTWQALRGEATREGGPALAQRWPLYGDAVAGLGVRAVAAVPLRLVGSGMAGALSVTAASRGVAHCEASGLDEVAAALSRLVLRAPDDELVPSRLDLPALDQFEERDFQPSLHQAAGMLAERHRWAIADAVALIRARAFVEDRPVEQVATLLLRGEVMLE